MMLALQDHQQHVSCYHDKNITFLQLGVTGIRYRSNINQYFDRKYNSYSEIELKGEKEYTANSQIELKDAKFSFIRCI